MYRWLHAQTDLAVAFFDATNTTQARRQAISNRSRREPNVYLLFVESICDDPDILERNYRMKLHNQDYKDQVIMAACAGLSALFSFLLLRLYSTTTTITTYVLLLLLLLV